jgi:PKD repeat protein
MKRRTTIIILFIVLLNAVAFATQEKKTARFRLTGPGGYLDETTIYFDLGITPAYGMTEDAPKAFGQMQYSPALYTITSDDTLVSTNGFSRFLQSEVVRVGVRTDTTGIYAFTAQLVNNFDSTTIIQLEDRLYGIFTNLLSDPYVFQLAGGQTIDSRFYLHFSKAVDIGIVTAGCANNDGQVTLMQDNNITWNTITLSDSLGGMVNTRSNLNGPYSFTGLPEGVYRLAFTLGNYTTTKTINLPGNYVTIDIIAPTINAVVNQQVVINTVSHNATSFDWKLGDGGQITGISNPGYTYYEPGTYRITVTATNDAGCEYTDSVTITVSAATGIAPTAQDTRKVWAYDNTVAIQLAGEDIGTDGEIGIFDMLGQPVYTASLIQPTTQVRLTEVATGYYIVKINNNQLATSKPVFIVR